jgi:hypothetical protein
VLLTIIAFGVLISLIGVHITDPGIIPVGIWSTDTAAILRGPIAMQFRKANDPISSEEYEQKFWYLSTLGPLIHFVMASNQYVILM